MRLWIFDHSGAVGATKEKDELLPQPAIALAVFNWAFAIEKKNHWNVLKRYLNFQMRLWILDHSGSVGATKEKDELLPQPAIALALM